MLWQISRKTSRMGKLLLSMVFQGTQYHQSKKKKRNYLKVTEAIPDVREVQAALDWKFYITFLFSVRKEEKEYKI